jgi:hypothetical protein
MRFSGLEGLAGKVVWRDGRPGKFDDPPRIAEMLHISIMRHPERGGMTRPLEKEGGARISILMTGDFNLTPPDMDCNTKKNDEPYTLMSFNSTDRYDFYFARYLVIRWQLTLAWFWGIEYHVGRMVFGLDVVKCRLGPVWK